MQRLRCLRRGMALQSSLHRHFAPLLSPARRQEPRLTSPRAPARRLQTTVQSYQDDGNAEAPIEYSFEDNVPFDRFRQLPRNSVTLLGRLGKDVVIRKTNNGKDVGTVNIAVENSNEQPDESGKAPPVWYRLTFWNEGAHMAANQVHKGSLVLVKGKLSKAYPTPGRSDTENLQVTVSEMHIVEKNS